MAKYNALIIFDHSKKLHLRFDRNTYLQQCVKNRSVLHVGCSDFPMTQQRIKEQNLLHKYLHECTEDIMGIDLSEEGIRLLKDHGYDDVVIMDAEDLKLSTKYDFIVAGDVLEHLSNPGLFLEKARSFLNENGEIIIGVPSALTFNNLQSWFLGREKVHPDHAFYFSPKTLSALCARFNLLPVKLVFTVQPRVINQSVAFILIRKLIITLFKAMAPSFIMHFKKVENVDKKSYIAWK